MNIVAILMLFASRGGERGQGAQISQKYSVVVNIPTTSTTTSTTALPTTTEQTLENAIVYEVSFVIFCGHPYNNRHRNEHPYKLNLSNMKTEKN